MHQRPNFASRSTFCQRLIPCTFGNISFSSVEANTASLSQQGASNTKSNCVSPAVPCCFLSNSNTNGIGRPLVRFLLLSTFTTDQHLFQSSRNRTEWWLCLSLKERIVSLAIIHFVTRDDISFIFWHSKYQTRLRDQNGSAMAHLDILATLNGYCVCPVTDNVHPHYTVLFQKKVQNIKILKKSLKYGFQWQPKFISVFILASCWSTQSEKVRIRQMEMAFLKNRNIIMAF